MAIPKLTEILQERENYIEKHVVQHRAVKDIINHIGQDNFNKLADILAKVDKAVDNAGLAAYKKMGLDELDTLFPIDDYDGFMEYIVNFANKTGNGTLIKKLKSIDTKEYYKWS